MRTCASTHGTRPSAPLATARGSPLYTRRDDTCPGQGRLPDLGVPRVGCDRVPVLRCQYEAELLPLPARFRTAPGKLDLVTGICPGMLHQLVGHGTRHVRNAGFATLWRRKVLPAIDYLHLTSDVEDSAHVVHVLHAQAKHFPLTQTTPKPKNYRHTVPLADLITHAPCQRLRPRLATLIRQSRPSDRLGPYRVPSKTLVNNGCLQDARQRREDAAGVLRRARGFEPDHVGAKLGRRHLVQRYIAQVRYHA